MFRRSVLVLLAVISIVLAGVVTPEPASSVQFPGGNGKIAFATSRDAVNLEIYTMNSDGSGVTRLTNNDVFNANPSFSPDGSQIVYDQGADPTGVVVSIYVMNTDGTGATNLSQNTDGQDRSASYSPDGSKIVFQADRGGANIDIYVMNSDGSGQYRLTTADSWDGQPSWSPDGSRISFGSDRSGSFQIWMMNSDGSNQTQFTTSGGFQSTWSPDGSRIAFSSSSGVSQIYSVAADGTDLHAIAPSANAEERPVWSPDGLQVLYSSVENTRWGLHVVNSDGSGDVNISNSAFDDMDAAWQSVGGSPTTTTTTTTTTTSTSTSTSTSTTVTSALIAPSFTG
jgi:Tol biopolymer transport system component